MNIWILATELVLALAELAGAAIFRDTAHRTPLEGLYGGTANHVFVLGGLTDGVESHSRLGVCHRLFFIACQFFI